jgi:hypothetical protein
MDIKIGQRYKWKSDLPQFFFIGEIIGFETLSGYFTIKIVSMGPRCSISKIDEVIKNQPFDNWKYLLGQDAI